MPCIIPLTYFFLLPHPPEFLPSSAPAFYEEQNPIDDSSSLHYTLLAAEDHIGEEEGSLPAGPKHGVSLSARDKWRLVKPLLPKYMLPLCEYPWHVRLFETNTSENIVCVYLVRSLGPLIVD